MDICDSNFYWSIRGYLCLFYLWGYFSNISFTFGRTSWTMLSVRFHTWIPSLHSNAYCVLWSRIGGMGNHSTRNSHCPFGFILIFKEDVTANASRAKEQHYDFTKLHKLIPPRPMHQSIHTTWHAPTCFCFSNDSSPKFDD